MKKFSHECFVCQYKDHLELKKLVFIYSKKSTTENFIIYHSIFKHKGGGALIIKEGKIFQENFNYTKYKWEDCMSTFETIKNNNSLYSQPFSSRLIKSVISQYIKRVQLYLHDNL